MDRKKINVFKKNVLMMKVNVLIVLSGSFISIPGMIFGSKLLRYLAPSGYFSLQYISKNE